MENRINSINGKTIRIKEMVLKDYDNKLILSWNVYDGMKWATMFFYNVSRIRLNTFSIPMVISGLEIIDHSVDGWDRGSTYEIHDYEDECVSFFCEYIEIE